MRPDTIRSSTSVTIDTHNLCMAKEKTTPEGEKAGQRIRAAREYLGLTQARLAKEAKIGVTATLGQYERGTRQVSIRAAQRLEKVLKLPAAYLMGLVDEQDVKFLQLPAATRLAILALISLPQSTPRSPDPGASPFPADKPGPVGRRARVY